MMNKEIVIATRGRSTTNITAEVQRALLESNAVNGLLNLFIQHTSASLIITENADPDVRRDLESFFEKLVKDGDPLFRHDAEGPDDMPAHIRSALTQTSINIPIRNGKLALGTWQGIFLYEHRYAPHRRRVLLTLVA